MANRPYNRLFIRWVAARGSSRDKTSAVRMDAALKWKVRRRGKVFEDRYAHSIGVVVSCRFSAERAARPGIVNDSGARIDGTRSAMQCKRR